MLRIGALPEGRAEATSAAHDGQGQGQRQWDQQQQCGRRLSVGISQYAVLPRHVAGQAGRLRRGPVRGSGRRLSAAAHATFQPGVQSWQQQFLQQLLQQLLQQSQHPGAHLRRPPATPGRHAPGQAQARPLAGLQAENTQMPVHGLQEGLHQELTPQGSPANAYRREAVQVLVGGLRVEVRPVGRADPPLPQAHGRQAVQVPPLRPLLLALRPPGSAHEEARVNAPALQQPSITATSGYTTLGPVYLAFRQSFQTKKNKVYIVYLARPLF